MPPRTRATETKPTESETPAETAPAETPAETAPPVEPTVCGANLADYNPFYRDILCGLDAGHAGNHSVPYADTVAAWPNADDPTPSTELCAEHYPHGWPSTEIGASAGCPHGTWIYEG